MIDGTYNVAYLSVMSVFYGEVSILYFYWDKAPHSEKNNVFVNIGNTSYCKMFFLTVLS